MKKTIPALAMMAALSLAAPRTAMAQAPSSPVSFFNISLGAQPQQRTVDAQATSVIYDEDAQFNATTEISNGLFYDISAGYEMSPNFALGVGVSFFGSKGTASGTGLIPDPLFPNQPTSVAISGDDLEHREQAINLSAVWFVPVAKKLDVAVSAGPTIFHMSQQFLSGELDASNVVVLGPDDQSGWGFGLNFGGDLTYLVTPQYGVGVLLRYTWGKVGLDAADMTAGGFQAGVGLRVRF